MRVYQYRCNDYSILTPAFKKWVVTPLIWFVPWGLTANFITLLSNLFVYIGLYLSIYPISGAYNNILISLCLIIYLIGDHLDGMQAKRTGTGSALGEFCDHYLDAFNNGIILFTMFTVFGTTNLGVIGGIITASYLAHIAVFYEQFKTGWLTFEKMGSLEGVLFSAVMIALASIEPIHEMLLFEVAFKLNVFEFLMIGSAIGALLTFLATLKRIPEVKPHFWIACILVIIINQLGIIQLTSFQLFIIITLYSSLYIGRIMRGHLIDGIERRPDWFTLAFLVGLAFFDFLDSPYSFTILASYLSFLIALLIIQVFSELKAYWVWVNPKK